MKLTLLAVAALVAVSALAAPASACTMQPPGLHLETEPAGVHLQPSCPPNPGQAEVRVGSTTIPLPLPI